jgi:DNA-binding response OmpR family regulator
MTPARVLIAVPDAALLDAYRKRLAADGFKVETARDGLECIDRLRAFMPEVLVLSTALPWGGGDGVLAVLSEDPQLPHVSVIVLSSGHDVGGPARIWDYPIAEYHSRPLSPQLLARRVGLRTARARRVREAV